MNGFKTVNKFNKKDTKVVWWMEVLPKGHLNKVNVFSVM